MQAVLNFFGRAFGCCQRKPGAEIKALNALLLECGRVGVFGLPAVGHDTNQSQLPGLGQRGHSGNALERHVNLAARHIQRGLACTLVRHMLHVDAGVGREQCCAHVLRAATATRCISDAARRGFGSSHQLGGCFVG